MADHDYAGYVAAVIHAPLDAVPTGTCMRCAGFYSVARWSSPAGVVDDLRKPQGLASRKVAVQILAACMLISFDICIGFH